MTRSGHVAPTKLEGKRVQGGREVFVCERIYTREKFNESFERDGCERAREAERWWDMHSGKPSRRTGVFERESVAQGSAHPNRERCNTGLCALTAPKGRALRSSSAVNRGVRPTVCATYTRLDTDQ